MFIMKQMIITIFLSQNIDSLYKYRENNTRIEWKKLKNNEIIIHEIDKERKNIDEIYVVS